MSLLVDASGQPIKVPFVLNEAYGNVIRMAFGIDKDTGAMPKKPRNLFKAGLVEPGSEKEKILHGMARKGLIQLIGVAGTKLNDADRLALAGALEGAEEGVAIKPDRIEATVTKFGLDCFIHTLKTSDAAREMAMDGE